MYDNPPFRLTTTPGASRRPAPLFGEHNDHVLHEILGLDEEEVNRLIIEGVVA